MHSSSDENGRNDGSSFDVSHRTQDQARVVNAGRNAVGRNAVSLSGGAGSRAVNEKGGSKVKDLLSNINGILGKTFSLKDLEPLLNKVNQVLNKDFPHKTLIAAVEFDLFCEEVFSNHGEPNVKDSELIRFLREANKDEDAQDVDAVLGILFFYCGGTFVVDPGKKKLVDVLERRKERRAGRDFYLSKRPSVKKDFDEFVEKKGLDVGASVAYSFQAPCDSFTLCGDKAAEAIFSESDDAQQTPAPWEDPVLKTIEEARNVLCAVDVASPKQLGFLAKLVGKFSFMIDHHKTGEAFADYYTCPEASACGELIYEIYALLIKRGAAGHDPKIARSLYAAISSDTGSFKYSNTTEKTHIIAAALVEEINKACDGGTDCAEIARILHDSRTVGELRAEKLAIENLRFACGGKLAYLVFTAEMMEQNSLTELDLGGLVDLPRSIEGVSVGLTIKQSRTDPRSFRLSSRSNASVNVAEICKNFGGGGHDKAAGASVEADSPQKAEEIIIPKFAAALEVEAARNSGK